MRDDGNPLKPLHSMSLRDIVAHNSYTNHDLHHVGAVGAFSIRPYSRFRQWLVKKGDDSMRQLEEAHMFGSFF